MFAFRTFSVFLTSLCVLVASFSASAHEGVAPGQVKQFNAERAGMNVSVGTGIGNQYSISGFAASGELRSKSGLGVSLSGGVGPVASWSVQAWTPGAKFRGGIGVSTGYTWDEFGGQTSRPASFCAMPVEDGPRGPRTVSRPDPISPSVFGLDVLVDHDIGQPRGWNMRYGLGTAVFASGCAGAAVPMPSVGLSYIF